MLQQPAVVPVQPDTLTTHPRNSTSSTDSERQCGPLGSSPNSYSPKSPHYTESPSVTGTSPAKHGKKKARNRPPKHIRKGIVVNRRPEDSETIPGVQDSGEVLSGDVSGSPLGQDIAGAPTADGKVADSCLSRVTSAPINVPLRQVAVSKSPGSLRLEAFSSPKWLGTGFSDQMESRIHIGAGPRCSGPMIDTASGQFTYFANSMW